LTSVFIARQLGPDDFGVLSAAVFLVILFWPFAALGVRRYWLQSFARSPAAASADVLPSFVLVALTTSTVITGTIAWAVLGPHDERSELIHILVAGHVVGLVAAELVRGKLQLEGRFDDLAWWQVLPNFLRLVAMLLAFLALDFALTATVAAATYTIASLMLAAIALPHLRRMLSIDAAPSLEGNAQLTPPVDRNTATNRDPSRIGRIAKVSFPFAMVQFFYLVHYQCDVVLLKQLSGAYSAGVYSVALLITLSIYLLPEAIYQSYLAPKIHRWAFTDKNRLWQLYNTGSLVMAVLGVLLAALLIFLAGFFVELLFGSPYLPSVAILHILAFVIPLHFVVLGLRAVLEVGDGARLLAVITGGAAILKLALSIVLISRMGEQGAAYATIISELVLLLCSLWAIRATKVFR
jgi:O-antigen/teichoic acid export membrane protein